MEKTEESEYTGGNALLFIKGKRVYCDCGCGVFTKSTEDPNRYRCNGCRAEYETEPTKKEDK